MPASGTHQVASRLAQLLGDVIVSHAPHTARISAEEGRRQAEDFLEGLESHLQGFVAPFLQQILDNTDAPPAVAALLHEAINPQAALTASIESIFLWGIISSIIQASVQPFLQGITNDLSQAAVAAGIARPVDLGTIATATGRGLQLGDKPTVQPEQWAYDEAAKLGVSHAAVDLSASIIGLPPAMQELFEMYRRGIIGEDDVRRGLREGDFRDDWISNALGLLHAWLTPGDFVRSAVQAQMSYEDARAWAGKTGLDLSTPLPVNTGTGEATPDMFGLAFSIAGRPPGPEELARAANRGLIPWDGTGADSLTFQQGIAESDVKTKWTEILQRLAVYVPPPRTVGTLLGHGAITEEQARQYWIDGGVPAALADGYVYMTNQEHVGQDKLLAKGEITTAYFDGILTNAQATEALGLLGYRDQVAEEVLAIVDFRREVQTINHVVTHVRSLYESFRISTANARTALLTIGVPADQVTSLLGLWDVVRIAPVRVPTTAEIGKAVKAGTITETEGLQELAALGYQPRDAAIVLSSESGAQVTPLPPAGSTTTG